MLSSLLLATLAAAAAQEPAVRGRLVDAQGAPLAGVTLAQSWSYPEPIDGGPGAPRPSQGGLAFLTGDDGVFAGPLAGRTLPNVLFAIDAERGLGRTVVLREPGDLGDLVLEPLATLTGSFHFSTAGEQPGRAAAWLMWDEGPATALRLYGFLDDAARVFAFRLPAGRYRLSYSTDLTSLFTAPATEHRPRLAAGEVLDLGVVEIDLPHVAHVPLRIRDPEGEPAARASGASFWIMDDGGTPSPFSGQRADDTGTLVLKEEVYGDELSFAFLVFDAGHEHGALVTLPEGVPEEPVPVRLDGLARVRGQLVHAGHEGSVGWTNVYVYDASGEHRLARCMSEDGRFELRLPYGEYRFHAYSAHASGIDWTLALSLEESDVDMGVVHLDPSASLELVGHPAPAWTVGAARGLDDDPAPSDFAGRYLLLEFWGHW